MTHTAPLLCSFLALPMLLSAQSAVVASGMPVRELTAFKDGHAFVLREAPLDPASGGKVALDELPTPLLGTFWPFASGGDARLRSARACVEDVSVTRAAVTLLELAQANIGKTVELDLRDGEVARVRMREIPTRNRSSRPHRITRCQ